jgi:hypothetical protein
MAAKVHVVADLDRPAGRGHGQLEDGRLIDLNKAGEHDPEVLCEQALKAFRQLPTNES